MIPYQGVEYAYSTILDNDVEISTVTRASLQVLQVLIPIVDGGNGNCVISV